jgi:hypothetical protein
MVYACMLSCVKPTESLSELLLLLLLLLLLFFMCLLPNQLNSVPVFRIYS